MRELTEKYAALLGMKPSEVCEVVPVDGGHKVRTHDGQWTLVAEDGAMTFRTSAPELKSAGDEPEAEQPQAAPKPRGRGRS
jgi:hypothetical protein